MAKRCARLTAVAAIGLAALVIEQLGGFAQAAPLPLGPASVLPTSLEAMGQPTEDMGAKNFTGTCYGYKNALEGAHLVMANSVYHHGFQVTTGNFCSGTWTWAWHIGGHYLAFTAEVGLATTDTRPATLSFVGPAGRPLSFRADGHSVKQTVLISGLPTKITMNLVGALNFVVETTAAGATIDFANDVLEPLPP
jgi:hypothetical protein